MTSDDFFKRITPANNLRGISAIASKPNPAEWMYERIVRSIADFERQLNHESEVGARLVSFSASEVIHISDVGYWGPDLIKFYGENADGHVVELIQHISQTNVLLIAVPKQSDEPRRIGFSLLARLDETDSDD